MADYRKVLERIQKDLFDVKRALCANNAISQTTTTSGTASGTIQSSALNSGIIPESSEIRKVNVQTSADTGVDVVITLHDSIVISSRFYRNSFDFELALTQSPIQSIVVTELDNTSISATINYMSK